MEPRDLWLRYLEPEFRDRAIRIEERNGMEMLIMGEQIVLGGALAGLGGSNLEPKAAFKGDLPYEAGNPPGSYDAVARAAMYDELGVTAGVVFPTIGILPFLCDDQQLLSAYLRAYNRWQHDFMLDAPGRIIPVATINWNDLDEAARELDACLERGFRAVFLPPEPANGVRPGQPPFDAIWSRCTEAGVAVCVHVVVRFGGAGMPFAEWSQSGAGLLFGFSLTAFGQIIPTISTMVLDGVFDRHPALKVVCVEAGCGWAPYLMDRLDEKHHRLGRVSKRLELKPSDYLRRNVWYVAEPSERTIGSTLELVGEDRVMWGSDFPHIDARADATDVIHASIAGLTDAQQRAVLGENAARVFTIPA
jgi:predicted TIM-barrel fold metal-dependent hydrolase